MVCFPTRVNLWKINIKYTKTSKKKKMEGVESKQDIKTKSCFE